MQRGRGRRVGNIGGGGAHGVGPDAVAEARRAGGLHTNRVLGPRGKRGDHRRFGGGAGDRGLAVGGVPVLHSRFPLQQVAGDDGTVVLRLLPVDGELGVAWRDRGRRRVRGLHGRGSGGGRRPCAEAGGVACCYPNCVESAVVEVGDSVTCDKPRDYRLAQRRVPVLGARLPLHLVSTDRLAVAVRMCPAKRQLLMAFRDSRHRRRVRNPRVCGNVKLRAITVAARALSVKTYSVRSAVGSAERCVARNGSNVLVASRELISVA